MTQRLGSPHVRTIGVLALALAGCGDASGGNADEASTSGSDDDDGDPSTTLSTTTTSSSSSSSVDTGSDDDTSSESTASTEESTGDPVEPCDEDPDAPGGQLGDALAVSVWPDAFIDDIAFDAAHRRILGGRRSGPIKLGAQTFELFAAEGMYQEGFIATLGADGEAQWLSPFHQGLVIIHEIGVTSDGMLLASGLFEGELAIAGTPYETVSSGARNGFLAGLDAETGAVVWVRTFTADSGEPQGEATDIVTTDDGGALVVFGHEAGEWLIEAGDGVDPMVLDGPGGVAFLRFDGSGALSWVTRADETPQTAFGVRPAGATRVSGGFAAGLYANGPIEIAGDVYENPMVPSTGHVIRLADDGSLVRDDMFEFGEFVDVMSAPCDDVIVVGQSAGGFADLQRGGYAGRITPEGELRWATLVVDGQFEGVGEGVADPFGQTVLLHTRAGSGDTFAITKLDGDGGMVWTTNVTTGYYGVDALAIDGSDRIAIGGYFGASFMVPGLPEPEADGAFVLDLAP